MPVGSQDLGGIGPLITCMLGAGKKLAPTMLAGDLSNEATFCHARTVGGTVMKTAMLALVFLASAACTNAIDSEIDLPSPEAGTGHGAIIRLEIVPVPEGPSGPVFGRGVPLTDENLRP